MDFDEIAKSCKVPVGKLGIKNKGSVVKFSTYYTELYNILIEKYGLICQETKYVHNDLSPDGAQAIDFNWFAYKELDSFTRIRFDCSAIAWYIKGDKTAGAFTVKYTLELDYNKVWRNSALLNWFLPNYLKLFYQGTILQWLERYQEELDAIKENVRDLLNVSAFD